MDADPRLAEIRARVQAATPGPWVANPGGHPGILTRAATGDILAVLGGCAQDEADADFIAHSREDIGFVMDLLDKYVGKEPTLRGEMAYLNRCLNAVYDLCREADKDGNTSDGKFTPAAVLRAASGEREDVPGDNRRRIYLDGTGQAWIETTEGFVAQIEMPLWDGEPIANVREKTGEIHEIGRTW